MEKSPFVELLKKSQYDVSHLDPASRKQYIEKLKLIDLKTDSGGTRKLVQDISVLYYQVQGQLAVCERNYSYFVCWTPHGLHLERIEDDPHLIKPALNLSLPGPAVLLGEDCEPAPKTFYCYYQREEDYDCDSMRQPLMYICLVSFILCKCCHHTIPTSFMKSMTT